MDDLSDPELEQYLVTIKKGVERRKSLVASNEDIAGTHESLDGEWDEWMCVDCGIFMKGHRTYCLRCGLSRF
jgi:hypothetical protein